MSSSIQDLNNAVKLFRTYPKSYEDLEFLSHFLCQFETIGRYLSNYSLQHRFKIIDSFSLQAFIAGEIIFRKGDPSAYYYFVLEGAIEAFNEERDGTIKHVGTITFGKPLGEIGILRSQPRSLTCIAKSNGLYLILTSEQFLSLLASHMFTTLDQKIKFIESFFPNVKKLTTVQKQRIAYAMGSFTCSRGQVISSPKDFIQHLYFISEGELIVVLSSDKNLKTMTLKLTPGNLIGEECVFFSQCLKYNISVSSEYSQIYTLQKQDLYVLLPPETIEVWKQNFKAKDQSRKQFIYNLTQAPIISIHMSKTFSHFKLASSYASKRLDTIQKRNEKTINSMDIEVKSHLINKTLKQYSPAAIMSQGKLALKKPSTACRLTGFMSKNAIRIRDHLID